MISLALIRPALATFILFSAVIGVIRARPYDDHDLRAALPDSSGWQAIQPGLTTADEALRLLEQNAWVGEITRADGEISWSWSGRQAVSVDASQPGQVMLNNDYVTSVQIPLAVGMGDLYLVYGPPLWNSTGRSQHTAYIAMTYPQNHLAVAITARCPLRRAAFWQAHPTLTLQSQPQQGILLPMHTPGRAVSC